MDTVALWEEEIVNERSHYFEKANNTIDLLYESINMDIKLQEEGLITEDTFEKKHPIITKIIKFIVMVGSILAKLVAKIVMFFKKIVNNVKYKMLVRSLKNSNIDVQKALKKLNKVRFYDTSAVMDYLYDEIDQIGVHDNHSFDFYDKGKKFTKDLYNGGKIMNRLSEVISVGIMLRTFNTAIKIDNYEKDRLDSPQRRYPLTIIEFDESQYKNIEQIANELGKILKDTVDTVDRLKRDIVSFDKCLKDHKKDFEKYKKELSKEEIYSAKSMINIWKTQIKIYETYLAAFLNQAKTIYAVCVNISTDKNNINLGKDFDEFTKNREKERVLEKERELEEFDDDWDDDEEYY